LTGYRQSHALSTEQEAHHETFIALRTLQDMLWDIEEKDQPAFRDRWYAQMINKLQALEDSSISRTHGSGSIMVFC